MDRIKKIIIAFVLLSVSRVVNAQQDYDFYLQKARQRLAEGDCTRAEVSYNTYKDMAHKTNKEIEQLIEECKNGSSVALGSDLTITVKGVSFIMKPVEGGTFWMGSQSEDPNGINYDFYSQFHFEHVHSVTLRSFYMGETEVTQALWKAVMGSNPSRFKGEDKPVESVNWSDVQEFLLRLNQITGKNFRLPTEAEWEYAARGGTNTALYNGENLVIQYINDDGDISPNLDALAWYPGNCDYPNVETGPRPVKRKIPNAYGLYDMLGNVREWCQDWYDVGYYFNSPSVNPQGPSSSNRELKEYQGKSFRVTRGGCWRYRPICHRVSDRGGDDPDEKNDAIGFRLCLPQ